jgi:hypothetical protein
MPLKIMDEASFLRVFPNLNITLNSSCNEVFVWRENNHDISDVIFHWSDIFEC